MKFTGGITLVWGELTFGLQNQIALKSLQGTQAFIHYFAVSEWRVACENTAWDVLSGGTSASQRQKFHTDDVNQCLHNKSGSHGVPNAYLFDFTFLLVDFGKVLCSSANALQQNSNASSREEYIPQILTVLLEIHRVYICPLWPFVFCLSFVNNTLNNVTTPSTNQFF